MSDTTTITVVAGDGEETLNPVTATVTVIGTVPNGPPGASGSGVPAGGTDGQVLTKQSSTDGDADWEDPTGGSGAVDSVNGETGAVVLNASEIPTLDVGGFFAATEVEGTFVELRAGFLALLGVLDGELDAEAALARNADNLTSGTVADARIPSAIARDSEVAAAISALSTVYQPLDSDLTAIAALTTTSYGRAFLALADAAAGRTALGLGTAATSASGDFQPIDSDLTAIAALTTTSFGRAFLVLADAAAARTAIGLSAANTPFTPNGSIAATDVQAAIQEVRDEAAGGGAPSTVDYLVGTADGGLSNEIVVGTSPGGELGGTWASPTVDATHSGSTHASVQAAAEATAAGALSTHAADTTSIHGIADTSALETASGAQAKVDTHVNDTSAAHAASAVSADSTTLLGTGTDVQAVLEELDNAIAADVTALSDHIADSSAAHAASAISASSATLVGTGTDVQAVLEELDNAIVADETALANHLADSSDAHDASAISAVSTTLVGTATDVQGVLEELDNAIVADEAALANHLADTSDAHDASAVSVLDSAGYFAATEVEAALAEVGVGLGSLNTQAQLAAAREEVRRIADLGYFCYSAAGCLITPNATPTKLNMAVGVVFIGTTELKVAAQTAITPGAGASKDTIAELADATNPKWVVVELDSAQVVQYNEGTAAAAPTFPTITATRVPLAFIYVPANATNVDTLLTTNNGLAKLIDARVVRTVHVERAFASILTRKTQTNPITTPQRIIDDNAISIPDLSVSVGDVFVIDIGLTYFNSQNNATLQLLFTALGSTIFDHTSASLTLDASVRQGFLRMTIQVISNTSISVNTDLVITAAGTANIPLAAQFRVVQGANVTVSTLATATGLTFDLTAMISVSSSAAVVGCRTVSISKRPVQ